MTKARDLKQREVINVADAMRLGYITDVDVDFETGKINAIIVPKRSGIMGLLGRREEYVIPWNRIVAIGPELVLVRLEELDLPRHF